MIRLKQPALALHSCDVPGYHYKMQTTWVMHENATARNVAYWIDLAIKNSANQRLENVVINCHGTPGFLHVGGSWKGFGIEGIEYFKQIKGKVGKIWLVACNVAESHDFCTKLAKAADCMVIAGKDVQYVNGIYDFFRPHFFIDDYETGLYFTQYGEIGCFYNQLGKEL